MGLYKFALKMLNIFSKQCIFYFVSIIISVAIIFNSLTIVTSDNFSTLKGTEYQVVTGIPFFLAMIVCLFTFYANSYFVMDKMKEMAITALSGISPNGLGMYLFLQNLIIEVIGTILGLILGIIVQPLFLLLMYSGLGISGSLFHINSTNILGTIAVLAIQLAYVSLGDVMYISKKEIKDLLTEAKQVYTPDTRSIKFPAITYLIIYFVPFVPLILGPKIFSPIATLPSNIVSL